MYKMSQRHPVWVAENHVKPCISVGAGEKWIEIVYVYGEEKNYFSSVPTTLYEKSCLRIPEMKLRGLVPNSYIHVWMI